MREITLQQVDYFYLFNKIWI